MGFWDFLKRKPSKEEPSVATVVEEHTALLDQLHKQVFSILTSPNDETEDVYDCNKNGVLIIRVPVSPARYRDVVSAQGLVAEFMTNYSTWVTTASHHAVLLATSSYMKKLGTIVDVLADTENHHAGLFHAMIVKHHKKLPARLRKDKKPSVLDITTYARAKVRGKRAVAKGDMVPCTDCVKIRHAAQLLVAIDDLIDDVKWLSKRMSDVALLEDKAALNTCWFPTKGDDGWQGGDNGFGFTRKLSGRGGVNND